MNTFGLNSNKPVTKELLEYMHSKWPKVPIKPNGDERTDVFNGGIAHVIEHFEDMYSELIRQAGGHNGVL